MRESEVLFWMVKRQYTEEMLYISTGKFTAIGKIWEFNLSFRISQFKLPDNGLVFAESRGCAFMLCERETRCLFKRSLYRDLVTHI